MTKSLIIALAGAVVVACGSSDADSADGVDRASPSTSINGTLGSGNGNGANAGKETCGDGLDNDGNGQVDEGCACTPGALQKCFVGDPKLAVRASCFWGHQQCTMASGGGELTSATWGPCGGSGKPQPETCNGVDDDCNGLIDDGPGGVMCDRACDALPIALGGHKVTFDKASASWKIQTDASGHPVNADGSVDTTVASCTIHTEKHTETTAVNVVVEPAVKQVFFQVVGAGGGGGRSYNPPSAGGGAGAYVAGSIEISSSAAPVTLAVQAGVAGAVTSPTCSEPACNFMCTCTRGPGTAGTDSSIKVNGASITAGGGAAGATSAASGGVFQVVGTPTPGAVIVLSKLQSKNGNGGEPGGAPGNSGPGGSPACDWGSGAEDNQSGSGFGGGGGGGNNSPAGAGSPGVVILMWTDCK